MKLEPGKTYRIEEDGAVAEIELDQSYKFYTIRKFTALGALQREEFYKFDSSGQHVLTGVSTPSVVVN